MMPIFGRWQLFRGPVGALPFLFASLLALSSAQAEEPDVFLVNGEEYSFERTIKITFWTTENPYMAFGASPSYKVLGGGDMQRLIADAKIDAPHGVAVRQESLIVYPDEESFSYRMNRTETTVTSECATIQGRWSIFVPDDFEPGEYEITVRFPNVHRVRDAIGAKWPTYEPTAWLAFRTARTEAERSANRVFPKAMAGAAYLVGGLLLAALLAGVVYLNVLGPSFHGLLLLAFPGIPAWYVWRGHFENSGVALEDAWGLSSVAAVVMLIVANGATATIVWLAGGRAGWTRGWEHLLAAVLLVGSQIVGFIWLGEQKPGGEDEAWRYAWSTLSYTPGIIAGWLLLARSSKERFGDKKPDDDRPGGGNSTIISLPPGME